MATKKPNKVVSFASKKLVGIEGGKSGEDSDSAQGHIKMTSPSGVVLFDSDCVACGWSEGDSTHYFVAAIDAEKNISNHLFILGQSFVHIAQVK